MRIEQSAAKSFLPSQKSRATELLMHEPTAPNQAELSWRFGLPVATLLLALLAIPMSAVNPRTGRFLNLLVAVFVYMIYSNLISIVQAWIAQGKVSVLVGMLAVHGGMVLLLIVPVRAAHRVSAPAQPGARGMRVLRRYIRRQVLASIILVLAGLLMLFSFFDLIYEMQRRGRGQHRLTTVLTFVALSMPGRLYELFPIAALIGTLFALAQLVVQLRVSR